MKTIFRKVIFFAFLLIISCEKDDKETCGDLAFLKWENLHADFVSIESLTGNAQFMLEVSATDICIYDYADITISIKENPVSYISNVNAFVIVPNSTAPGVNMNFNSATLNWTNSFYDLNLRQGFTKNPGNFKIRIFIYIPAVTQTEALQKYDASVNVLESNIVVGYKRPN